MGRRYPRIGQRIARTLDHPPTTSGGGGGGNGPQEGGETGATSTVGLTGTKANQPSNRFTGKSQSGGGSQPDYHYCTVAASASVARVGGATVTLTLTAKGASDNLLGFGGATVTFGTSGGTGTGTIGSVTDVGDGTYTAAFTGTANGLTAITITAAINGDTVTTTMPTIRVYDTPTVSAISPASGSAAGGASVTITGTKFDSAATVTIGGAAATSVVVVSTTSITCVTPSGTDGAQDVVVTNTDVSGTLTGGYTYSTYATPNILNNASFEGASWSGFRNANNTGDPTGSVALSTDYAYDGSYALKFAWDHNAGDQAASVYYYFTGAGDNFMRAYFYHTAYPNGPGYKFGPRFVNGQGKLCGIQILDGYLLLVVTYPVGAGTPHGAYIRMGAVPSLNAWHSIELECDYTNQQVRAWLDNVACTPGTIISDPDNVLSKSGNTVNVGTYLGVGALIQPDRIDVCQTINPTTNTGAAYFDYIALSTAGRIGP